MSQVSSKSLQLLISSVKNLLKSFSFLFFQCVEYWQEEENCELHISVKLYAKKETHMVRALLPLLTHLFFLLVYVVNIHFFL